MATFIITNAGKKLQAKVLAGKTKYSFTKIALGDGFVNDSTDYKTLTDLKQRKADVTITSVTYSDDNTCSVSGVFKSTDTTTALYVREAGLYATDPDDGEILFAAHYYDSPTVFDSSSGSYSKEFVFVIGVESADQVSLTVNTAGIATQGYVQNELNNRITIAADASKPASMGDNGIWVEVLSDSEVRLNKYNATSKTYAVVHPETEFAMITDIYPSAAAHNAFYRGKDLTSYFTSGEMSKAIAAGTFADIYPGDYITKSVTVDGTTYSDVKWIVADLDYHLHRGDTETTAHHVVMIPENDIGTSKMNTSDVTTGGYQGSYMWGTTIPKYVTGITAAFGSDHVLTHRERLTKMIDTNAYAGGGGMGNGATVYTSGEWVDVSVNIPNEAMMYGHAPFASSGRDTYDCNKQLAIFRYGQNFTRSSWCWLRDVASAIDFADVGGYGEAGYGHASHVAGVRPYFLLR